MYKVTPKTQEYTESATVTADGFGDWMAVNTGTEAVSVDGYPLQPGEGLNWKGLQPDVVWNSSIKISIPTPGGAVRITRLQYKEVKGIKGVEEGEEL